MKRAFAPERLDVAAFADASARLAGQDSLSRFPRLSAETVQPADASLEQSEVQWEAAGESRRDSAGRSEPWLHLFAEAIVPLVCQRCLGPVGVPLEVDRWFRFVADEETAAALDEEVEEDVLVVSREFDLKGLIEDELLMSLPVTPTHDVCPESLPASAVDADFEEAEQKKPNPFAALDKLRREKK
ncbi:YceD family protein [Variovorax dokdonensis]|uniref:Large ribosomal RNA subunit accumulation protein YceD n=1 Tax=Variovorax dokdonensis TaxID=344883 RepID=A0ABT7N6I8_9BURK|nr:YceD family protein [Variovorax dokdonensis]MDM0043553.1 YceD family protein [Variovorax dokdonensis]